MLNNLITTFQQNALKKGEYMILYKSPEAMTSSGRVDPIQAKNLLDLNKKL